jgi:hypothetical protein
MDPEQVTRDQSGALRCRECGFAYTLTPDEVVEHTQQALQAVQSALQGSPADRMNRRVAPEVWSINGYMAHLDEAGTVILSRVRAITQEDRPALPYYDQDAAAEERRYDEIPAATSLGGLQRTVPLFVEYLRTLPAGSWERVGVHRIGEVRLAEIAHDMPHELRHHAGDIRRLNEELRTT